MTTSPLVSVIIPAHNAAKFIIETVESVLAQSWRPLEIIVIDDGSDDNTREIVEPFVNDVVRVISQEKTGASAARNAGLRNATGRYVQFLDADDILSPAKIELQVKALGRRTTRSVASCTWAHFVTSTRDALPRAEDVWTVSDPIEWLVTSLSGGGMMQTAAWLTPRAIIDDAGPWDESLSLHDDGEFFLRVLLHSDYVEFVPNALVYYRSVTESLSRQRKRSAIDSAYRVCVARDEMLLAVRDDATARRAVATQYAQFAYEFRPSAPDLAYAALNRIGQLGAEPAPTIGGNAFRSVHSRIGFARALRIRSLIS